MGTRALGFFKEAERFGGVVGKMKLAALARVTSAEAGSAEDTADLLIRLEQALQSVRTENGTTKAREVSAVDGDVQTLRKHIQVYLDLMTQRALVLGDVGAAAQRVCEGAADGLDVARASIWLLDESRTKISCLDLFEKATRAHSSGIELHANDFPPYFAALMEERTIAAHDAHQDPRTSCFSPNYLTPLNIHSLLDVPIWVNGIMVGVVCHEHTLTPRTWNADEEKFAHLMSSFLALAIERATNTQSMFPSYLPTQPIDKETLS